ncbi:SCP-2 sterol transfer family protein [Sulfurovum sp. bin170]|uniref:SCP-2 sterol transfer family protein n=1 Tax=Sulfurovum sp. bin170 TaxID=2695268 RepID=UPI0013DF59EA|nr:SCP-2 sterol transfer family protein [Sulfurovum sp. bin170]NEW60982.1 SCP-2 sterol transfer family protein [Sulfurovum sp. bin170]
MTELFSDKWINELKDLWNATPEVSDKLAQIDFDSTITCGFKDNGEPSCVFVVEKGKAVSAGLYNGETADWDMRASQKDWDKWTKKPLTMTSMGVAVAMGKLKFVKGDFSAMIKNPSMAIPFVKSFALMSEIS